MSPRVGDIANAFAIVNTGLFMGATLLAHSGGKEIFSWLKFDDRYLQDGFCVTNKNSALLYEKYPLLQSHILCFYFDSIAAVVLILLGRQFGNQLRARGAKTRDAFSPVASAAGAVFAHGAAHLGLWFKTVRQGEATSLSDVVSSQSRLYALPGVFAFFFFLLRSAPSVPSSHAAVHGLMHAIALVTIVPPVFSFSYVQTVLLWVASGYDLFRRPAAEKDAFYDLFACIVTVPIGLVAWVEGCGCDSFMTKIGGHLLYDATIPVSMFVYYAAALCIYPSEREKEA